MPRITPAEIHLLLSRTRSGDLLWRVDGRRCRVPDYVLELRATSGPVLSRVDADGVLASAVVRSGFGLLPRGRAVRALAAAVEDQVTGEDAEPLDLTDDGSEGQAGEEPEDPVRTISPGREERPAPSLPSPSGRSGPSVPAPSSGRVSDRRRTS